MPTASLIRTLAPTPGREHPLREAWPGFLWNPLSSKAGDSLWLHEPTAEQGLPPPAITRRCPLTAPSLPAQLTVVNTKHRTLAADSTLQPHCSWCCRLTQHSRSWWDQSRRTPSDEGNHDTFASSQHCCPKPHNATTSVTQSAVTKYTANASQCHATSTAKSSIPGGSGCGIRTNPTSRDSQHDPDTLAP